MAGFKSWLRGLVTGEERQNPNAHSSGRPSSTGDTLEVDRKDFALTLYEQLVHGAGNVFFSPFSIGAALGMALAGARGETASQMSKVLGVAGADDQAHATEAKMIERLNATRDEYQLALANSLWAQDDEALLPSFLEIVKQHYGAEVRPADFRKAAEAARVAINRWVEANTKEKIRDVIPQSGLTADTRLVLVNAVYFKGLWLLPFDRDFTMDQPFYLEDGGKVLTALMHQQEEFRYLKGRGYQAVDLSYEGSDLSMLVLLPNKKNGLRDLEKRISLKLLHDCVAKMRMREIKLFIPKFKMTCGTIDLGPTLCELGMPLAFISGQADFSGINGREPSHEDSLFLSAVFHKAFVEVNEKGTEAAAATAVAMRVTSALTPSIPPRIPIFRADHPFWFAIRDRKSKTFLFMGRIADPTREN